MAADCLAEEQGDAGLKAGDLMAFLPIVRKQLSDGGQDA